MVESTNTPPTTCIIDASFALSFLLPDEANQVVDTIFESFAQNQTLLIAPQLLPYEVANGLAAAVARKRITRAQATQLLEHFRNLAIIYEKIDVSLMLETALEHKLSAYDAAYLTLSSKHAYKLLTFDKRLQLTPAADAP